MHAPFCPIGAITKHGMKMEVYAQRSGLIDYGKILLLISNPSMSPSITEELKDFVEKNEKKKVGPQLIIKPDQLILVKFIH